MAIFLKPSSHGTMLSRVAYHLISRRREICALYKDSFFRRAIPPCGRAELDEQTDNAMASLRHGTSEDQTEGLPGVHCTVCTLLEYGSKKYIFTYEKACSSLLLEYCTWAKHYIYLTSYTVLYIFNTKHVLRREEVSPFIFLWIVTDYLCQSITTRYLSVENSASSARITFFGGSFSSSTSSHESTQ